ncbi:electron transport complex subunit RsxC [Marinomonas posidonica]|uniref:Ion-translocating oxidoreductase complex subunit C n=1 Tax=Marinomonas posidonica (strain CECT 7376 / NCIMB 14433 / IVIA-Po-181) TaxID=491952 RepID=F6CUU5_MARPP|nr:electron transport complex subunit RsxC [Marinomonas posidonica]AEF55271.1 Electron transport complex protein rnfC [Marinomonas posidonica IVIA-Po-181]
MQAFDIFSFHGGIHPPENKAQSLQLPLGRPSLPQELILPLGQHIGQSSRPLVNVGDKVLKGQTIAINNGFLSSFLHAPTSGTITAIEERLIAHPSGLSDLCVIIQPDGLEEWQALEPLVDWQTQNRTDVLAYLSEMGIVGMGGAGFPTQVKLQGANKSPLTHFIINAAECEPYITADDMLIREKTLELILGIEVLQHLVNASQVVIGIEDNKPTAIKMLNDLLNERNSTIKVAVVPTKYPSGGEKQLIQLLTGKEVPSGQHPADIGILCQNVGTCVAVHDAIHLGRPLISRFTTLTGDALNAPQNVEVLLGTPVSHLLTYADAQQSKLHRLVMGGPMMGFTLDSMDVPVVKTSNCILAATKQELPPPAPEQACIRCGMCEQACPVSLLPQQLLWFSKSQEHEKAEHHNLFDCIECGACSYVCPSSIPLVQYYRHSKSSIREARESAVKADLAKQRFEARKARQEAEAAEKEAKRLARQKPAPAKDTSQATAKAAPAAAPAANDESKKLKVDLAIAKTKLKKLEKQLLSAQENEHLEEINSLQLQVTDQANQVKDLDAQMAKLAATASTAKASPAVAQDKAGDELKKAKVDLALASVKLKKAQKQLDESPDDADLKQKVASLIAEQQAAQAKLDQANAAPKATVETAAKTAVKPAVNDEIKKAKVDLALAGVKLKKVQKQLDESPDDSELKRKVADLQAQQAAAQAKLDQATANDSQAAPNIGAKPAIKDELKKLKIDAAIAKAAVKKVEKALKKAEEIQAPEIDTLRQQLKDAQQRADDLEHALANPNAQQATATTKSAENNFGTADEDKKRKVDLAIAKAGIKKAEKNLALLKEQGKSEEEIQASEWPQKLNEAQQKLAQLETLEPAAQKASDQEASTAAQAQPAAPTNADDDKKRKIDLAIAKAGIKKAEKNLALLKEQGKSEEEIQASEWPQKLLEAQQKLAQLESNEAPQPSKAEPSNAEQANDEAPQVSLAEQIKQQKIAVALAKAQANKLTKKLGLEPDNAEQVQIEIAQLNDKQAQAQHLLEQLMKQQESQ